jgi:hypothetical protein
MAYGRPPDSSISRSVCSQLFFDADAELRGHTSTVARPASQHRRWRTARSTAPVLPRTTTPRCQPGVSMDGREAMLRGEFRNQPLAVLSAG